MFRGLAGLTMDFSRPGFSLHCLTTILQSHNSPASLLDGLLQGSWHFTWSVQKLGPEVRARSLASGQLHLQLNDLQDCGRGSQAPPQHVANSEPTAGPTAFHLAGAKASSTTRQKSISYFTPSLSTSPTTSASGKQRTCREANDCAKRKSNAQLST